MLGPRFIPESIIYTQSVMRSPRFIPSPCFIPSPHVVHSPCFILTGLASQFPLFSSRDQQGAVGSLLRMEVIQFSEHFTAAVYTERKKTDLVK